MRRDPVLAIVNIVYETAKHMREHDLPLPPNAPPGYSGKDVNPGKTALMCGADLSRRFFDDFLPPGVHFGVVPRVAVCCVDQARVR